MKKILNLLENNREVFFVSFVLLFLILISYQADLDKNYIPEKIEIQDTLALSSKAVYIFDENNKEIIYSENAEEVFEIASITKLMTAIIAMEDIDPESNVTIDKESYLTEGDTGLLIDEVWKKEDLVAFMLANSSNDAAEALAKSYPRGRDKFVERMNDKARELGLLTLVFNNPTGLNETEEFGGRGSARDVAELLLYTYHNFPSIFEGTSREEFFITSNDTTHTAINTNLVANSLFGLQAGKTGFTDKAGGSMVIRFNLGLNTPIVAVILGTSTREERFSDIKKVIDFTSEKMLDK